MERDNMWKKVGSFALLASFFLFGVLLLSSVSWACEAGFVDTLNIKVIDHKYRPIEDAKVTVTYQKDRTTGKGYVTTNPQYTGADGKVEETIRNSEVFEDRVECGVTITAEYDGVVVEREIEAQSHSAELQLRFEEAYLLNLKVVDRYGSPIAGTQIRVNEMYRNTSSSGFVAIIVNKGDVDVAVPYLSGVISEEIQVEEDTTYTLQARVYPLNLQVVDDQGDPLVADIIVEDEEYEGSEVEIEEIALQSPYVKVVYGSLEKTPEIDLASETDYIVSFDLTPPEITNVEVERDEDELRIRFFVYDHGAYATGADLDETTVSYTVGGVTEYAVPYVESGSYIVDMPVPDENSLLRFTITTYDMEGNMQTVNGQYLVTPGEEEEEDGEPIEEEETGEGGQPPTGAEDNTLFIVIGAVVVLVLAYAVWSYIRGLTEEE
ncbi:hypothetical protein GF412_02560 [Candidatus Micrarchaeota archaeon]|nr:hypothetical protein [Candidatus Micrarchaeota archaeon]MBD3417841.1 hypothetical protein [Candidatus Micrarchaeota archaeon]